MNDWIKRLPPPILTSEPGSFARRTFEERIPRIVNDTILGNDFPREIVESLQSLHDEIKRGVIVPLYEDAPDRPFWDAHSKEYVGRAWTDVPWYWAEAFFYRRVLEATRYFQPGAWHRRDPYANLKNGELLPEAGPHALATILHALPESTDGAFRALLHSSLWGNRADLSYNVAQDKPGSLALEREHENLLVDDATRVWEHLKTQAGGRIDFLCDNAGTELLFDFALVDFLLHTENLASLVTLHLKPHPFFVSDAMIKDATATLATLVQSPEPKLHELGQRLQKAQADGRFIFAEHWFAVTSLFYFEMPDDLAASLAQARLVISKGDANYRRLLGDAHWDPTTPFANAVGYLPVPLAALRTLKSELIVGLQPGEAERLQRQDPTWRVNGQKGIAQFKS